MDLHLKHSVFTGQILCLVLLRESYIHIKFLFGLVTGHLLLKAGDKGTGAQLQRIVLALAAVKCNAVHKALKVDLCGVAHLGSTVFNSHQSAVSVQHIGQLVGHILIVCLCGQLHSLQALILAQLDLRIHSDLHGHIHALGLADGLYIQLGGRVHRAQTGLLNGSRNNCGIHDLQRVLIEEALTVELFDHTLGSLALSEAGQLDRFSALQICVLASLSKFLRGNGNLDFINIGVHFIG